MKTNITISIDVDVAEKLKEEKNKSDLINAYLRNYFGLGSKTPKEIQEEIVKQEMDEVFR